MSYILEFVLDTDVSRCSVLDRRKNGIFAGVSRASDCSAPLVNKAPTIVTSRLSD